MRSELNALGIYCRAYGKGSYKTTCPQCSNTRRNKSDPCLSVTIDHEYAVFNCHHCNFQGKKRSNEIENKYRKVVELPTQKTISPVTYSWFSRRGISKETLEPVIKSLINKHKTNFKGVGQPLRIALVGSRFGPGLYDVILSLNKTEVINRLNKIK